MTFKKGHHSSKVVTLTLPNSAKPQDFLPHNPALFSCFQRHGMGVASGHSCRSHTGHAPHLIVPWCSFQASRPHSSICFWLGYCLGALDRWELPLREDGEKLNWPSRPPPPPPGTAANRPCPEPGRQALSTGGPRASSLAPRPQLPLLAPKDTDGKGFPGTQPNCLCRFARKEIQTPQHKKKSSKWIQAFSALLTFSLLLGLLHGSYSSMLDRETLAYTSSLLSLL